MSMSRLASLAITLVAFSSPSKAQVINEFVANHVGLDNYSYVEIAGDPSTDYSAFSVVEILGDTTDGDDEPGAIGNIWAVGTTDSEGIWVSAFGVVNGAGDIDNGTKTLLLVTGFTGTLGLDLDTNNDGTLDTTPWTSIADDVAVDDGYSGDIVYSAVVLGPNFDGISIYEPGGASRVPNGTDTDSMADWTRNDFDGEGLPGFSGGTVAPGEVANSPGLPNPAGTMLPPPVIDEIVLDHVGVDSEERIEIWGQSSLPYSQVHVLVVDSDGGGDPGLIEEAFQVGTTNGAGLWSTPALVADSLGDLSRTVLLVGDFSGSVGDDLDSNDDGIFDSDPWSEVFDDLALDDGSGADVFYSSVVLTPSYDGLPGTVGGASRIPSGVDTDSVGDWVRNDFDGAGLSFGLEATLGAGEAWNTPGAINRVREADYWSGILVTDAAGLRHAIHQRVDDHQRYAYSSDDTDSWEILELADEDPLDETRVVAIYKNVSYAKFGGGTGDYNREHSWPQSYGFPVDSLDNSPRSDTHQLFISDVGYNSDRGNLPFGTCSAACSEHPTMAHNGFGGLGGGYPGDSNWSGASIYEVWNHRQGDIARAQLYLDVRYEGGNHGATGFAEPDLELTDNTSLIVSSGGVNTTGTAYMGRLSTLLAWHLQDPVDEGERRRNDVVWAFQGNRNPFIDHPEWVGCVFGGDCSTIFADDFETGGVTEWSNAVTGP